MSDTALPDLDETAVSALVAAGERIQLITRYTREDIARFAMLTRDSNPVHHDRAAAQRAGLPDVIASGQHTSALMSGMAASHFSRRDDGVRRDMLCLNFNFAYKTPIYAEQDVALEWVVASTEWNESLRGVIAQLDGKAVSAGSAGVNAPAVIARGTVLVRHTLVG